MAVFRQDDTFQGILITSDDGRSLGFDALITSTGTDTSEITDHVVEEGIVITDHIREKPYTLSLAGYVSQTPTRNHPWRSAQGEVQSTELVLPQNPPPRPPSIGPGGVSAGGFTPGGLARFATDALVGAIFKPDNTAQLFQFADSQDFVRQAYDLLREWQSTRTLLRVAMRYREVENLAIQELRLPRTVGQGGGVEIQLAFRQIRTATTETTVAPRPAEPRGQAGRAGGTQATSAVAGAAGSAVRKSALASGADGLASLVGL